MRQITIARDVYLDTSVIVNAIIGGMHHSESCLQFCYQLAQAESHVYFSRIVRLEFSQALRNLASRAQLPEDLRSTYGLDDWYNYMVRERWLQFGVSQFADFLRHFSDVTELPFSRAIWEHSVKVMAFTNLQSHDAIHIATARRYRISHFAACDSDFQRVDGLKILLIRDGSLFRQ